MIAVLLDTNVASLLHPSRKGSDLLRFFEPHLKNRTWAISFQTYAELWSWAEHNSWGHRRCAQLESMLKKYVVMPFVEELGRTWARVMTQASRGGKRLEAGDAWIAATAVLCKAPLLTRDTDLVGLPIDGLEIISPGP